MSILHLPYSDPSTIPTLVPAHVTSPSSPVCYRLPEDMNDFLCQLLEVKKRELCSCVPIPLVQPQVTCTPFVPT